MSYLPFIIYQNIFKCLSYRKLVSNDKKLSEAEFTKAIKNEEYFTVNAIDSTEKKRNFPKNKFSVLTKFIIVEPNSEIDNKKKKFDTLFNKIIPKKENLDIVFITKNLSVSVSKTIIDNNKTDFKFQQDVPWKKITHWPYNIFIIELPKHFCVPKQEIVDESEKKILEKFYIKKFPEMKRNDPIIGWIDAWPGDIIKITSDNRNSGKEVTFRMIK